MNIWLQASRGVAVVSLATVLATGAQAQGVDLPDPLEPVNRVGHAVNKELDRFVIRPTSELWEAYVPLPIKTSILSFNATWAMPMRAINSGLQGKPDKMLETIGRFSLNATLGLLGFVDLASEAGLAANDTYFSETLGVWGVGEGIYLEVPLLGPGTSRDLVGRVVDIAIDPFSTLNPAPPAASTTAEVLDVLDTRASFGPTVDGVLYDSADSYEALKLITVQQSRRAASQGVPSEEDFLDIYAE